MVRNMLSLVGSIWSSSKPPVGLAVRSSTALIVATTSIAIFTDMFLYGVIVPVVPFALQSRAGIPEDEVQRWVSILLAVYGAATLVASPVTGYFADHTTSRQFPLLLGLIALAASTILLCVGSSIGMFVAGRIFQGLSAAVVWTAGLALLVDTVKTNEIGQMLGYVGIAMGLGLLLAPLLGGVVLDSGGYYAVFAMCFALLAVDIVLRLAIIEKSTARKWLAEDGQAPREVPSTTEQQSANEETGSRGDQREASSTTEQQTTDEEKASRDAQPAAEDNSAPSRPTPSPPPPLVGPARGKRRPSFISLLSSTRILCALWAILVVTCLLTSFDSVLPLFVHATFDWDSLGAGLIFLPLALPTFLSPLAGAVADRYGSRWLTVSAFLLSIPPCVCLRFVTHKSTSQIALLCVLLALLSLAAMVVMTAIMAEMTYTLRAMEEDAPGLFGKKGAYAQAYSLFNVAFSVGCVVGPLLAGFIRDSAGWPTMGWSLAILSAFSVFTTAIWTGPSRSVALHFWRRR